MGVRIDPLTMDETVQEVEKFVIEQRPLHLMGVNADKINQCQSDEAIKKIVNESEIINADGASVVLASRFLGYQVPERVAGIDLMQRLLKLADEKSYSVYFLVLKKKFCKICYKILKKSIQIYELLDIVMVIFLRKMSKIFRKIFVKRIPTLYLLELLHLKKNTSSKNLWIME